MALRKMDYKIFCIFVIFQVTNTEGALLDLSFVSELISLEKAPVIKLPPMCATLDEIAITGFSSGGAHTMQYHVSNSERIKKVGIFAGIPYSYSKDQHQVDFFIHPELIDTQKYIRLAEELSDNSEIDNVENLADSKVYVFHGTVDNVVNVEAGKSIVEFYKHFEADIEANVGRIPAEHGIPAKDAGGPCPLVSIQEYYVQNCSYNGVYHMFRHLYGPTIKEPEKSVGTVPLFGTFEKFDQKEFLSFYDHYSMDDVGFIYTPSGCKPCNDEAPRCKVSFIFHGCFESRVLLGKNFALKSGFLEMAELNNIILIFPNAKISLKNPKACWDFLGYNGDDFYKKSGKQNLVTDRFVNRVLSSP